MQISKTSTKREKKEEGFYYKISIERNEESFLGEKENNNSFYFDLDRMIDRVENQDFTRVPKSAVEDNKSFDDWLLK